MDRRRRYLEERLELAERHVTEWAKRIDDQRARIAIHEMMGLERYTMEEHAHWQKLRETFLACQLLYEEDRDRILGELSKLQKPLTPL